MVRFRHVLALPLPAQGHVTPLLKIAHWIDEQGVKVTFVNTEQIQDKLMTVRPELFDDQSTLRFVTLPDWMGSDEDGKDADTWVERYAAVVSPCLRELIEKINGQGVDDEKISCVINDVSAGWALEVAKRMGIEAVGFWPAGASCLLLQLHIPKLIEDGVIDEDGKDKHDFPRSRMKLNLIKYKTANAGIPLGNVTIKISDQILAWNSNALTWSKGNDPAQERAIFGFVKALTEYTKHTNIFLCNSFAGLEPSACEIIPGILPVVPLMATNISKGYCNGSLLAEDSTCLDWLDEQGDKSVVYVALGSSTVLTKSQFEELAAGLEETGRPFLWVVKPDLLDGGSPTEVPDGFLKRVQGRAKIVTWAPQERVLEHKSTACFLSHCGWNSIMEGISNGVPFICLPYFSDQYQNSAYICDVWKVGVKLSADENGAITRHEVKDKIEEVLGRDEVIENSSKLKEMARGPISEEGSSMKNLLDFIEKRL